MAKAFSWSYSKYKNFFACAFRHQQVDLLKNYTDTSEALTWGNETHDAFHAACRTDKPRVPLPDTMQQYQHWVDKYADPSLPGTLLVEQQYAITKQFQPTDWFGRRGDAWFRSIVDLLRISPCGRVARAADWKTGKILQDSRQLMLCAQTIFAHHPKVKRVKTEFVWLKDDCTTEETFDRATIMQEWPPVLVGVKEMERAAQLGLYTKTPSYLCFEYCPVKTCENHGKRHQRR